MDFREHKKYLNGVFKTKAEIEQEMYSNGITKIYYVLSFGGGTQSTHLFEDHLQGKIHYDYIIMSDTGAEPQFIHDQVAWWKQRQKDIGNTTPFIMTHHGSMTRGLEEMLFRYFYTDGNRLQLPIHCSKIEEGKVKPAGIMPRQCTVDFKIVPVQRTMRNIVMELEGLKPGQRFPKHIGIIMDLGFSADELNRISTYVSYEYKYVYLAYPLVESNLTTIDSINFLKDNNMPSKRSRCYLCPFNCDKVGMNWTEIIEAEPMSFLKACWFDTKLREIQASGTKNMHSIPFLHYSRQPLQDVFKKEFNYLGTIYEYELEEWVDDWKDYIKNKYHDIYREVI